MAAVFGKQTLQSKFTLASEPISNAVPFGKLYPHQIQALQCIKEYYRERKNETALVVLPTGAGKSGIAILAPYVLNATKVLVITPSVVITEQLEKDFCGGVGEIQPFIVSRSIAKAEDIQHFVEPCYAASRSKTAAELKKQLKIYNLVITNAHKLSPLHSNTKLEDIPQTFDLVIVDEAHHYPAETWKRVVDHFQHARKLFLTATPFNNDKPIAVNNVELPICYEKLKSELVDAGVIRLTRFIEANDFDVLGSVTRLISLTLYEHDKLDNRHSHLAMVLTHTTIQADDFVAVANALGLAAGTFHATSPQENLKNFKAGKIRVLAVCGKLLEGFDQKEVSVVAILRNVAKSSRALFTQFVGRAVRKIENDDPVTAVVISHSTFKQQANYDSYCDPKIAEVEPNEEE